MTISTTTNRVSYAGNGATTAFAFGYYFLADADLVVIKRNTSTGAETTQTLTTHYTVSGAGNPAGGTVTFVTAPSASEEVIVYRDPAVKQEVDLVNNDPLPVETSVEQPLDRLTMICQRLADRIGRALRLTDGDTSGATITVTPSADKLLGWNSGGTALENKALATIGAVQLSDATPQALTGTGSAGTSATVSRSDHKHASGTAATKNTGTSGDAVPLLNGANTWSGVQTMSGKSIIEANASVAAHATTMDPWSSGNYVTLTGTAVTFTNMAAAPQAGAEVELYMNAAHVFTDGAVFEVDGNANYTAAIGDRVLLRAKSTTVFTVHPRKADGTAVGGTQKILQVVNFTTGAVATGTTLIPADNTVPQITEGDEYMTLAITPANINNKLFIQVVINTSHSVASDRTAALFLDAAPNALAASCLQNVPESSRPFVLSHFMTAGTTSSITFRVRAGSAQAGTTTFNGRTGAGLFGGVLNSSITITEIAA